MPHVSFDLSINIPLLLTLIGMAVALVRLLTRLEDGLKRVGDDLGEHTQREEKGMDWIRQQLGGLTSRVDRIEASAPKERHA